MYARHVSMLYFSAPGQLCIFCAALCIFLCSTVHFLCITQRVNVNSIQISQLIFCMHLKHCAHLTCVYVRTYLRICAQNVRNQQWDHCWCHNRHHYFPRSIDIIIFNDEVGLFLCTGQSALTRYRATSVALFVHGGSHLIGTAGIYMIEVSVLTYIHRPVL